MKINFFKGFKKDKKQLPISDLSEYDEVQSEDVVS